jgi:hypothetical protein
MKNFQFERNPGIAEELGQRRAFGRQAGKYEPPVAIDLGCRFHGTVRIVRRHTGSIVTVRQGDALDTAIQMKRPRVVRAYECGAGVALTVAAQLYTTMRASVVQDADLAVSATNHDHRLAANLHGGVVASFLEL